MLRRSIILIATHLFSLTVVSALASLPLPVRAEGTIRIGVTGPFSGGSSSMGISMRNGIRLASQEINQIGGINGKLIELVERDDEAIPAIGSKIAQEFARQKVAAVIGIANTGVGLVAIDQYQQAKIPLLITASTGPTLTKKFGPPAYPENYIFRLAPALDLEAKVLVEHVKKQGLTSIAIMADSTAYGEAGLKALQLECQRLQIEIDFQSRFNPGEHDMGHAVKQGKKSAAKALIVWGIGPELAVLAKAKQQADWKIPLLGSWTLSMHNFIDGAGKAADGALVTQTFVQDAASLGKSAFLSSYQRSFKTDMIDSPMSAAQAYDGMHLLARAMLQANSPDGSDIREALENLRMHYEGAITTYHHPFSSRDHEAVTQNMILLGKVVDGHIVWASRREELRGAVGQQKARQQ